MRKEGYPTLRLDHGLDRESTGPMRAIGDICTTKGTRERNEDYVLLDVGFGACIADGAGGAPLGDALARLACHTALNAMRQGLSAIQAGCKANQAVKSFIEQVDSPSSDTGLMVVKFDLPHVGLAWYGNLAYFVCREGATDNLATNLYGGTCLAQETIGIAGGRGRAEAIEVGRGDVLIACTDGVWKGTSLDRIGIMANESRDMRELAAKLVFGCEARDNATSFAVKFE